MVCGTAETRPEREVCWGRGAGRREEGGQLKHERGLEDLSGQAAEQRKKTAFLCCGCRVGV